MCPLFDAHAGLISNILHAPHIAEFDLYFNSHAGTQGTNRPAKYSVLADEVGFSADSLQLLTYRLRHTFFRCTKWVCLASGHLPNPVIYLLAFSVHRAQGTPTPVGKPIRWGNNTFDIDIESQPPNSLEG